MNYLAILACGVIAIIVGFIWFGPLFGKTWMRLAFGTLPSPEEMKKGAKEMPKMALIQFVLALVMAYVLSQSIMMMGTVSLVSGLTAGFWNWLGFVVPTTIGMVLWEGKPWKYWLIIASEWLVTLLLMGTVLALWQ